MVKNGVRLSRRVHDRRDLDLAGTTLVYCCYLSRSDSSNIIVVVAGSYTAWPDPRKDNGCIYMRQAHEEPRTDTAAEVAQYDATLYYASQTFDLQASIGHLGQGKRTV